MAARWPAIVLQLGMFSGSLEFPEIAAVYARFTALMSLSADLGGCLLLYMVLDSDGVAVAMSSNVAGAASLGIEPDAVRAKQALRTGVCDFLVNNLDEALRVLKNEVRSRRRVSVVLAADPQAVIAQIVERGVQPDILASPVRDLIERGARMLPDITMSGLIPVAWTISGNTVRQLPVLDGLAARSIEGSAADIDPRVRWIEASAKYLGRPFAGQRFLRMTSTEANEFVGAVKTAVSTGAIAGAVSITCGGETTEIVP